MTSLLAKSRITAQAEFNRWLIPPAALAIHLCIGEVYAFSVFTLPLTKVVGIAAPTTGDWERTDIVWTFTLAMVCVGLSVAFGGKWLERVGPRASGVAAACLWGLGFVVASAGVRVHNIGLLYLGYGVLGGFGLGIGYVTPVSTLMKWFPDRRGMATGLAIMGFGGGALIAAPLSQFLMTRFATPTSVGVAETFLVLGVGYFVAMLAGAFLFRLPPEGWRPAGWLGPGATRVLPSDRYVAVDDATRTPQFYLLWLVLVLNVTAGIGVLGSASAMIQDTFPNRIDASAAAGFVGLLSLFNMGGRFFWASVSDRIGRKATYALFFALGAMLYTLAPWAGRIGSVPLFVACLALGLTMYGGGFATVPAYLADLFGTRQVGAIHGRILTAWAAAGIVGPMLFDYLRQAQVARKVAPAAAYDLPLRLVAGLLVVGFVANLLVTRVAENQTRSIRDDEPTPPPAPTADEGLDPTPEVGMVPATPGALPATEANPVEAPLVPIPARRRGGWGLVAVAWVLVASPLAWGVLMTAEKAAQLFATETKPRMTYPEPHGLTPPPGPGGGR